jgi:glyoxylase-like metal-dependent hydrolase (beta-lactamase superfamily II)
MTEKGFPFDLGKYKCTVFSDGILEARDSENDEVFGLNCLFLESAEHKMLIDCGCGDGFQSTAGHLVKNLEAGGIKCTDIDTIVLTHGHIDHVAGTFSSKGRSVFPGTRYITSEKEWRHWLTAPGSNELQNMFFSHARKYLVPVRDKFELVDDNVEVLPGIRLVAAHGHTPGNNMVSISSGGKCLLCIGDVIHSPCEFIQPDCLSSFDVIPGEALSTRVKVLADTAKSGVFVFACHFAFPGLGYIRHKKGLLTWQAA